MAVAAAACAGYLGYVFRISAPEFWTSGIGDWMDPYFINALLEHWYQALIRLDAPASPPIYFPVRGTLGYSHGLVLFAPFYIPFRLFTHPLLAHNLALVLVMAVGGLSLYAVARRLGLAFGESLAVAALFATSQNVVNGPTSVWSQRASVFLIPPILWLLLVSWRGRERRPALALGGAAGLLAALLYVQDFYTAHFALMFAVLAAAPHLVEHRRRVRAGLARFWARQPHAGARAALAVAAAASVWSGYLLLSDGIDATFLGVKLRSHDWQRPLAVAAVAAGVFARLRTGTPIQAATAERRWLMAVAAGGLAGSLVFLWIYLPVYREHRSFPEEHLLNALVVRDAGQWRSPLDVLRDPGAYDTRRTFALVFAAAILSWLPWPGVDRRSRAALIWLSAASLLVLLAPLSVNGFSLWMALLAHLPGFGVIRDPKRIVYLYELAAALGIAMVLARLPSRSMFRTVLGVLTAVAIVADWNRATFTASRPVAVFDRWVGRPVMVDPACESFFVARAPAGYTSRSDNMWTLFSIDATFVALLHGIPTLNGYSAWYPEGWDLFNPQEAEYQERVVRWIRRHRLANVCELDLEARTMRLFRAAAAP